MCCQGCLQSLGDCSGLWGCMLQRKMVGNLTLLPILRLTFYQRALNLAKILSVVLIFPKNQILVIDFSLFFALYFVSFCACFCLAEWVSQPAVLRGSSDLCLRLVPGGALGTRCSAGDKAWAPCVQSPHSAFQPLWPR